MKHTTTTQHTARTLIATTLARAGCCTLLAVLVAFFADSQPAENIALTASAIVWLAWAALDQS
tara:strand:- start:269 stop:457 length:189 start_codon:yes stop_codon:yes gene_type:complete